ncbi:hypothetical protein CRENBAI_008950 [Crenichthys baileyi]|uniref:Uncharacterized protein n=1 Tax=Crenichthys baileyi TaxID=28760 RepID=A0AAV9R7V8_9TELE
MLVGVGALLSTGSAEDINNRFLVLLHVAVTFRQLCLTWIVSSRSDSSISGEQPDGVRAPLLVPSLQISTATRRRLEKERPFIKHEGLKIKEASCFSPQLLSLIWARAPSASHQRRSYKERGRGGCFIFRAANRSTSDLSDLELKPKTEAAGSDLQRRDVCLESATF